MFWRLPTVRRESYSKANPRGVSHQNITKRQLRNADCPHFSRAQERLMPPAIVTPKPSTNSAVQGEIEPRIHEYGERIFTLMDAAEPPSLFSRKGFYGTLMDFSMRDENFKTQLFRFVDVLPTLTSNAEVARHLNEYLGDDSVKLSPAMRLGL